MAKKGGKGKKKKQTKKKRTTTKKGTEFENKVAKLFRIMGYKVKQDEFIQNRQIDILAEKKDGLITTKIIVECKDEYHKIITEKVQNFYNIVQLANVNKGVFISSKGFVRGAKDFAKDKVDLDLFTYDEFANNLVNFDDYIDGIIENFEKSDLNKYYIDIYCTNYVPEALEIVTPKGFKGTTKDGKIIINYNLEKYVNELFSRKKHKPIAILGNFGTGKTSFCKKYAYELTKLYKEDKVNNRIPVVVDLKEYDYTLKIQNVICNTLYNKFGVKIDPPLCLEIQKNGQFVFLFDGLDEMARKVTEDVVRENIEESLRVLEIPENKVLLTSRTTLFTSEEDREDSLRNFDTVYIQSWGRAELEAYLKKVFGKKWEENLDIILNTHNLEELAKTPVFLDMIVKTLSKLKDRDRINNTGLYLEYTNEWIVKEAERHGAMIKNVKRRSKFVEELAFLMFTIDEHLISYPKLREFVEAELKIADKIQLDYLCHDAKNCNFLSRDDLGNFKFNHQSFMEFFIAKKFASEINKKQAEGIGRKLLTPEIIGFLKNFEINRGNLWEFIKLTRDKSFSDVQYLGGNAITMLSELGEDFSKKKFDFFNTVLDYANFSGQDLSGLNFQKASLKNANLNNTILKNANFSKADLEGASFYELGSISSVAWSPDGKYLASCGEDTLIRIWDATIFKEFALLKGHTHGVNSLSWHNSSNFLVSSDDDGTVIVWNITIGQPILSLKTGATAIRGVSYSPDNHYIAYPRVNGNIQIHNAETGEIVRIIKNAGGLSIRYSPDGKYVAVSEYSKGKLQIFRVPDWELETEIKLQKGFLPKFTFNSDGTLLAIGTDISGFGVLVFRSGEWKKSVSYFNNHDSYVNAVAYLDNPPRFASVGANNVIRVWDAFSVSKIIHFSGHSGRVNSLSYSSKLGILASGSQDATIRIWGVDTNSKTFGKCLHTIKQQINCEGAKIIDVKGISDEQCYFFRERDAILGPEEAKRADKYYSRKEDFDIGVEAEEDIIPDDEESNLLSDEDFEIDEDE